MSDYTLLMIVAIPLSVFVFYSVINQATSKTDATAPRFKIVTVATGGGPMHFVYRHLGFAVGWSITHSFCSANFEECERWIERAKIVKEGVIYR